MDNLVFYSKESTSRFQRTFIGSSNYPPIFHRWASPYRIQQRWAYCLSVPGRTDHLTWAFLEALFSAIGPLGLLPKSLLSTSKEFMVIPRKAPAKGPYFQESMAQKWLTSAYPLNSLKVFILFSRDSHSFSRTFILLLSAAQWLQVSQSLPRTCDVLWKPAAVQDLGQSEVTVAPGVQNFRDTPSSILHGSCMTLRVSLSLNVMSQTPHFWERAHFQLSSCPRTWSALAWPRAWRPPSNCSPGTAVVSFWSQLCFVNRGQPQKTLPRLLFLNTISSSVF